MLDFARYCISRGIKGVVVITLAVPACLRWPRLVGMGPAAFKDGHLQVTVS